MNKLHWNMVELEMNLPHNSLLQLIDHSYDLVVSKLTKKVREELANL